MPWGARPRGSAATQGDPSTTGLLPYAGRGKGPTPQRDIGCKAKPAFPLGVPAQDAFSHGETPVAFRPEVFAGRGCVHAEAGEQVGAVSYLNPGFQGRRREPAPWAFLPWRVASTEMSCFSPGPRSGAPRPPHISPIG